MTMPRRTPDRIKADLARLHDKQAEDRQQIRDNAHATVRLHARIEARHGEINALLDEMLEAAR